MNTTSPATTVPAFVIATRNAAPDDPGCLEQIGIYLPGEYAEKRQAVAAVSAPTRECALAS